MQSPLRRPQAHGGGAGGAGHVPSALPPQLFREPRKVHACAAGHALALSNCRISARLRSRASRIARRRALLPRAGRPAAPGWPQPCQRLAQVRVWAASTTASSRNSGNHRLTGAALLRHRQAARPGSLGPSGMILAGPGPVRNGRPGPLAAARWRAGLLGPAFRIFFCSGRSGSGAAVASRCGRKPPAIRPGAWRQHASGESTATIPAETLSVPSLICPAPRPAPRCSRPGKSSPG
jgi:hypothetical protein